MMNKFAAAILTFLLLGSGTYVLAATGGGSGDGGNAAVTQYVPKPPETPTYTTTSLPKPKTEEKGGEPESGGRKPESEVGGEKRGHNGPSTGAQPETQFTSAPVETAATGPAGAATGLPFTGLDLLLLALTGLLLLALGVVSRRVRKSP
jgi:hypothetical protein